MADLVGQPRIEILGMEGEYHLIGITFPVMNSSGRLDVVPNGCYGVVVRVRPHDLPRYPPGAQLVHKTLTMLDENASFGGVSPPEAVLVPQEEWEEARNKEDAGVIHPCNSWNINECDCKGACSCHWRDLTEPKMIRASGDVVCEVCGKKYYDHPMDMKQLSYDGRPFLHIHCDGTRLKL